VLPDIQVPGNRLRPSAPRPSTPVIAAAAVVVVVLVATVVVVLTRSGGSGGVAPIAVPPATAWQRTDLHAVTQPVVDSDRFVVYVGVGGRLRVVSLFAGSGVTAWARNASASVIAPGSSPFPTVVGGQVVYLEPLPRGDGAARLVAADTAGGDIRWRSDPGYFTGWPSVCPGDPRAICISGTTAAAGDAGALHFDAGTGRMIAAVTVSSHVGRELAPDLYDAGERDPELLVATSGTRVVWRRPLDEVVPLRGATTDYGWNFDRIRHEQMFVGSVGSKTARAELSGKPAFDLSRTATVGFGSQDGAVRWVDRGTYYLCNIVLCPGASESAGSTREDATTGGVRIGVRLRASGLMRWAGKSLEPTVSKHASGVLEGFDPRTGRVVWTFGVGRDVDVLSMSPLPSGEGSTIAVHDSQGHAVLLDLQTGKATPLSKQRRALACTEQTTYRLTMPYRTARKNVHRHLGQPAVFACNAEGLRSEGAPPGAASLAMGSSRLAAWSDTTGVYAAPLAG
jgi:outer membrane protein assembly factor BamB